MITVYGFKRVKDPIIGETRDLRALWALEETGLPYRVHGLDFIEGETQTDDYRRISPFNQVPVIDDDGFIVAETGAIVIYLAEKASMLIPADLKGRSRVTQWCCTALNTIEPTLLQIQIIDGGGEEATGAPRRPALADRARKKFTVLEEQLSSRPYLAGDDFTVADCHDDDNPARSPQDRFDRMFSGAKGLFHALSGAAGLAANAESV